MVVVPAAIPLTMPVLDPTVATPVFELVQVPPAVVNHSVMLEPAQSEKGPPPARVIGPGLGFTVIVCVAVRPHGSV